MPVASFPPCRPDQPSSARPGCFSCARTWPFDARRQPAALLAGDLPEGDQVVDPTIRRQQPVVGPAVIDEVAHLVHARVHPGADAHAERIEGFDVGIVFVVRREDRSQPIVVSGIDDEGHRLFHPFGGLLLADIVEHEQLHGHERLENIHLGGLGDRIVGAANQPQEVGDLVENPLAPAPESGPERRDGQVRLADAVRTDEAEALGAVGESVGKPAHGAHGVGELLVGIDLKILEVAAPVTRRNPGFVEEPPGVLTLPALAAHDAAHAVRIDGLPTGVVADGARHDQESLKSDV